MEDVLTWTWELPVDMPFGEVSRVIHDDAMEAWDRVADCWVTNGDAVVDRSEEVVDGYVMYRLRMPVRSR